MHKHNLTRIIATMTLLASSLVSAKDQYTRNWVEGPLPQVAPGAVSIAVLPDTEYYSWKFHDMFYAQTRWIADEAERRNIQYAIHLGDVTQHNTPEQWEVARKSFAMLDGKVPYAVVPGNDDYDDLTNNDWEALRQSTAMNRHLQPTVIAKWPTFGGFREEGRLENTYHLFRMHDRDWMILCLEMGPRDNVIEWADRILKQHANRRTIVVTHAYLFRNNKRYDHRNGSERASPHPWGNGGEQLWQKLIRKHKNIMIVMSGHVSTRGIGYRTDKGEHGNVVHQMMCDYQKKPKGGLAYMRLLEFAKDGKTVRVQTYSPHTKKRQVSDLEDFTFTLRDAP